MKHIVLMKHVVIAAAILVLATVSVFSRQTGGDKGKVSANASTANRRSQPPDPLVSHKSPGRNKRSRHHRRRRTPSSRNASHVVASALTATGN